MDLALVRVRGVLATSGFMARMEVDGRGMRDARRRERGALRRGERSSPRALLVFFNLNFRRALEATPELIWRYPAISPVFVAVSRRPARACYGAAPAPPRPGGPYRRLCKQVLLWSQALLSTQTEKTNRGAFRTQSRWRLSPAVERRLFTDEERSSSL